MKGKGREGEEWLLSLHRCCCRCPLFMPAAHFPLLIAAAVTRSLSFACCVSYRRRLIPLPSPPLALPAAPPSFRPSPPPQRSSKYGRYLTADQLRELVSPPAEEQARVVRWLRRSLSLPAAAVVSHGDHVQVAGAAPAAVARTFGCAVHRFRFSEPQSQSQRHWPRQAEPRTGAAGAANPADQPPPPAPRYLLRCVGDVTVPAKFGGLVTGTLGLVEFPPQFHGGPFPHPQPSDLQPAEPLPHQPQPQSQLPADQQSRVDPQPQAEPRPQADDSRSRQRSGHDQALGQGRDQADPAAEGQGEGQPQQQADATVADHDHDPAGPAGPAARRPLAHPPITFRTPEQLRRVALQFEREQLQRRPHDQPQH